MKGVKMTKEEYKASFMEMVELVSDDKKTIAERLCEEAAFMAATLDRLKAQIDQEGATLKSKNGNGFDVVMENPAQKSYNTMIKNYNTTFKGLIGLFPENAQVENPIIKKLKTR